jgi:hypothetical protein
MGLVDRHNNMKKYFGELTAMLAELKRGSLTFPHVGVLRASANLEKGILFLTEKKGDPISEKGGRLPHIGMTFIHLSASHFSKYFFQLFI